MEVSLREWISWNCPGCLLMSNKIHILACTPLFSKWQQNALSVDAGHEISPRKETRGRGRLSAQGTHAPPSREGACPCDAAGYAPNQPLIKSDLRVLQLRLPRPFIVRGIERQHSAGIKPFRPVPLQCSPSRKLGSSCNLKKGRPRWKRNHEACKATFTNYVKVPRKLFMLLLPLTK